ncbi:MAG: phosphomannomutase/phosphoglucomutase [SAR86 cluster bacterium]|nr:phosphomannomutase/phosphoglucomutase [SAR86 cluster bacterium]
MNGYNHAVNLNQNIFRANDIRGIAFEDLNEEVVFNLGKALGSESLTREENEFIIGRDARLSSPKIFEWLSSGVLSTGCNVINIGVVTSPMFYHATYQLQSSSGVVITGSHNPGEYNGFKIVFKNNSTSSEEILSLRERILNQEFVEGEGQLSTEDIRNSYIDRIIKSINLNKKLDISIDCGNGAAGVVAKEVYERLGCNVTELFGAPDGNFPNHHPDPSRPENVEDLIRAVKNNESVVGLAFDGDADRLGVISSKGEMIFPDMQMILFSRQIIKNESSSKIVFDVKCSKLLSDEITRLGGEPLICKTGHTFIKQKIREEEAFLGGEMSGHIFFNDRWPGFDDGIYAGARMLEIIANSEEDNVFNSIPHMFSTPEINIPSTDEEKFKIVEQFKNDYKFENATIIDIDGIRIEFEKGWGLLRASNTSPVLVLRFEAETEEELLKIKKIFLKNLQDIKADIKEF